jgi:hypothetical protein
MKIKNSRQVELAKRRQSRNTAQTDNAEGYRAGYAGEPLPVDASRAFRVGHKEGSDARAALQSP